MIEVEEAVQALSRASVRFIIVGGVAATVHGSARLTEDLDVVYARDPENLQRLADALRPYQPYLRGAPPGLPFLWGAETLRRGLNFTLSTTLGDLDLLGEIAGGGRYSDLLPYSTTVPLFGMECLCGVHLCLEMQHDGEGRLGVGEGGPRVFTDQVAGR